MKAAIVVGAVVALMTLALSVATFVNDSKAERLSHETCQEIHCGQVTP